MAGSDVKVVGGKRLAAQLLKLAAQGDEICNDALKDWADDVKGEARRDAPVLTGALVRALDDQVDQAALEAEVGIWDAAVGEYAAYAENGNSRQEAQPFLLPAFERHRNIRPYVRDALHRRL